MIGDLTSKSALVLLNLLSAHKLCTEDYWFFYSENWEGEWLILILLHYLWYWTTKLYIFWYCIYWTMIIIIFFGLNVSNMSFIIILFTHFESVISCHFYYNYQSSQIMIQIYFSQYKYTLGFIKKTQLAHNTIKTIHISYNQQAPNNRAMTTARKFLWTRS